MIRWFEASLVAVMVTAATGTFWVKHDARGLRSEIAALDRRIAAEESAIELQRTGWSLLSQPDRLQTLVETHQGDLGLRPTEPSQFVSLAGIGAELDAAAPVSVEDAIASALDGIDLTATGSVR